MPRIFDGSAGSVGRMGDLGRFLWRRQCHMCSSLCLYSYITYYYYLLFILSILPTPAKAQRSRGLYGQDDEQAAHVALPTSRRPGVG
jgi:hypothetical protein